MNMVVMVYKLVKYFPDEEKFGLTAQIKRSAVSIPSILLKAMGAITLGTM